MGRHSFPPTGNVLLDAVDDPERNVLLAACRMQPINAGSVFMNPGDRITSLLFPTRGTLSLVAEPERDRPVEAVTIGKEGVANIHAALGSRESGQQLIGQIAGELVQVDVETFAEILERSLRLRDLVFGYIEALFSQASFNAACNATHHVDQRCARWLLASHDRVDADTFVLKHDFLAIMLGVHRPTVSIASQSLQSSGCITYKRGVITIVDRDRLAKAACSCYDAIQSEYRRLVPLRATGA